MIGALVHPHASARPGSTYSARVARLAAASRRSAVPVTRVARPGFAAVDVAQPPRPVAERLGPEARALGGGGRRRAGRADGRAAGSRRSSTSTAAWAPSSRRTSTATTTPTRAASSRSATLDWSLLADGRGGAARARRGAAGVGATAGARGLKVWKDLGLGVRDAAARSCCPAIRGWGRSGRPRRARPPGGDPHRGSARVLPAASTTTTSASRSSSATPSGRSASRGCRATSELLESLRGARRRAPRDDVHRRARRLRARRTSARVDAHAGRAPEPPRRPLGAHRRARPAAARGARACCARHPDRVLFGTDSFPPYRERLPAPLPLRSRPPTSTSRTGPSRTIRGRRDAGASRARAAGAAPARGLRGQRAAD